MTIRRSRFTSLFAALLLASVRWAAAACITDPIVTNNADSGLGSLREAIGTACAGSRITFSNTVGSSITLNSPLEINQSLTIQGPGANLLTISGSKKVRVFRVGVGHLNIDVTLSGVTIAHGQTPSDEGGGGIINYSTGVLTISNCTLSGNSSSGVNAGFGGAIYNYGDNLTSKKGTLNVVNSTLSGNSASNNSDPSITGSGSSGGAIYNFYSGTVNVINSTLVGNTVNGVGGSGSGGAILNDTTGTVNLINSTVFGNSVNSSGNFRGSHGGGITNNGPGTVTVSNTIIAGNTVTASVNTPERGPDVDGTFTSQGYNLIGKSDTNSGFINGGHHDQVGSLGTPLNPMLGPLAFNGGPTQTQALLAGSPAIDRGSSALTTDQRGFVRPINVRTTPDELGGNGSDIGAFEYLSHKVTCAPAPNTTMVAWYPFDETTGTLSANLATGNTGAHVGSPTPISGKVAGALRFDGVGSYVESPSTIVTNIGPAGLAASCSGSYSSCPGDFSIDTWIRVDPPGSDLMTILDKRIDTPLAVKGYHFVVSDGALGLQLADGIGSGYSNYFSPDLTPPLTDGDWHHIAVTVRRTKHTGIRWYHNGVLVGISDPTDRLGSLENNSPLRIGTRTAAPPLTGWFAGDLDELDIFNRALTPQEVASIFNAGALGKCR